MPVRRTSSELRDLRDRVRTLADAQHGVFRRSDLAAWGFEPSAALTMRRNGTWVRLHHGVYADRDTVAAAVDPVSRHALLAAATVAALPGDVALFGPSASTVLGSRWTAGSSARSISCARGAPTAGPSGVASRLSSTCRARSSTSWTRPLTCSSIESGLPIVAPELAACSTAMLSDPDWAVATLDAIAWQDPDALERLASVAELWPRLAGAGVLRRALPHVRTGRRPHWSPCRACASSGRAFPSPRCRFRSTTPTGLIGYVDMLFELAGRDR